jgi:hypothetical protein
MALKAFKWVAVAAIAAVASYGSTSRAASVVKSGDEVDGWTVTFGPGISLVNDGYGQLTLEKFAILSPSDYKKGVLLNFTQASSAPSSTISIATETVTNESGVTWTGFQNILSSPLSTGSATFASDFDSTDISPFTKAVTTPDTITYSGGTLANGKTGIWGDASANDIVIDANPTSSGIGQGFTLKEIPIVTAIPLPSAVWSGLSGLALLAVVGVAKKARRLLA